MVHLKVRRFFFLLMAFFISLSLSAQKPLTIIFSQDYGPAYRPWILRQHPATHIVSLYHVRKDSVAYWLAQADGFLLNGGEDVYPGRYGMEKDTASCGAFDLRRDSLEYQIIEAAFTRKKPVFGVCRGEQILNVYLGGTLYVDVPTALGNAVTHSKNGPTEHEVKVLENTSLSSLSGVKKGTIKSNHHQGINKLGAGLKPMATSDDGLIEAVELPDKKRIPFLMAVQWHPERMSENDPLSNPLAKAFVQACRAGKK